MIHPEAIKEFIERQRDSHTWMKRLSVEEINDILYNQLGFKPSSKKRMGLHQKVCFILGVAYPGFAHWLDMGAGKTRLVLELINYLHQQGKIKTALVLVPTETVLISWENEIAKWNITLKYEALYNSSTADKWNAVTAFDGQLILATYAGLTRMLTKLQWVKQRNKPDVRKLVINETLVNRFAKRINALVFDEATKIANKDSTAHRLCHRLAKVCPVRYELAGIPFGRDPIILWAQLYLIDRGATLGDTIGMYRAAFFNEKRAYFGGGFEYTFKKTMKSTLARIVQHRSITYTAEECVDIPKVSHIIEKIKLPGEAKAYYERFVKQIKASHAGFIERKNIFVRMRQVSSGFVGFTDDETGERAEISFAVNPKLDRLVDLITDMPDKRKFVVFHEFTNSGRFISNRLTDLGVKHERIWGGNKDVRKSLDKFNNDERCRGVVLNSMMGAYGTNLQAANYLFFFESPVAVIDRRQAEKRVARQGQTRKVFMFDLVCEGTADENILKFHKEGADLYQAIIKNPSRVFGK